MYDIILEYKGAYVIDAIGEAMKMSRFLEDKIYMLFNGIKISVDTHEKYSEIQDKYWEAIDNRRMFG